MTRFQYFAAVDMDCDGPSTSVYRVDGASTHRVGDNPTDETFALFRQGYFGRSDFFAIDAETAAQVAADGWHLIGNGVAYASRRGIAR